MENLYGMQRIVRDRLRRDREWAAVEGHRRAGRPHRGALTRLLDRLARWSRPVARSRRRTA